MLESLFLHRVHAQYLWLLWKQLSAIKNTTSGASLLWLLWKYKSSPWIFVKYSFLIGKNIQILQMLKAINFLVKDM